MRSRLAVAVLLAAGGCALVDPTSPPGEAQRAAPAASVSRSSANELVAYLARIRGMNDAALATEAARQRRDPADLARVKAALALALAAQSEEGEILALVDPVAKKDNGDRDARAMAGFLQILAHERRRLKESAAAAGNRLRDERRLHEAEKQRADLLQQKLDALTELEKSLSDRPTLTR